MSEPMKRRGMSGKDGGEQTHNRAVVSNGKAAYFMAVSVKDTAE